jgi:rubredoxin
MRSLFPNSYMCPRCGCGPIEHEACDNLKSHHNERRGGKGGTLVKVSNACPRCGFFSKEISDWKPWDGFFDDDDDHG